MPKGTVNTELVKQAYTKVQYDSDMLLEFQQCCDPNDGPMFFMKKYVNTLQEVVFLLNHTIIKKI